MRDASRFLLVVRGTWVASKTLILSCRGTGRASVVTGLACIPHVYRYFLWASVFANLVKGIKFHAWMARGTGSLPV